MSELFIASEVHRLEKLGLPLRLYAIKPGGEDRTHPVVERIKAPVTYLPRVTPLSAAPFWSWLRRNLPVFTPALRRTIRRHPIGLAKAIAAATAQSFRARESMLSAPRTVYVWELLLAIALADQIAIAGDVRHLHAHFAHGATTVAWLAAKITGLPFSFTGHAKDLYQDDQNPAGLLRRKMLAATFVATCTGANEAHLREVAPDARIRLVYHGLNDDFARMLDEPESNAQTQHDDLLRIVSVGRLVPKKGHDVLLQALSILAKRAVPFEAVIAGEPDVQEPRLRSLIAELGLGPQVQLLGILTQREILDLYRRSDLFVLACRITPDGDRDGIPNVMVEAMASGLAVVSTDISGIPELITDGHNGLLVEPEQPKALANAIARIALDSGLRQQLALAAAQTIRDRFDGDALAGEMATLLGSARK